MDPRIWISRSRSMPGARVPCRTPGGSSVRRWREPGHTYQMGHPPLRVDVTTNIPAGDFETAWARRSSLDIGVVPVHFVGLDNLIAFKTASGRDRVLRDVEALKRRGDGA